MSEEEPPAPGEQPPYPAELPGEPELDDIVVDPAVDDDESWADAVEIVTSGEGYARTPNEIHCLDRAAADRVVELVRERDGRARIEVYTASGEFTVRSDVLDVDHDVAELREEGVDVEPSYLLFLDDHGCGCGCGCGAGGPGADPVYASPVYASPVYASPVYASASGQFAGATYASPVYASPVYASPVYASPVYASAYRATGKRATTARPTHAPPQPGLVVPPGDQQLFVLDSGLAAPERLPPFLDGRVANQGTARNIDPPGPPSADQPDPGQLAVDYLHPVAGHGTFIAGLVEQLTPGRRMEVFRVFRSDGAGRVPLIAGTIAALRRRLADDGSGPAAVVNLSFSGYGPDVMRSLARAVRRLRHTGAVVVASAGNDGTCRPTYPAVLPGVVSVGALTPLGPARFSNHGSWVRACAPGEDLVSSFYRAIDGPVIAYMPGEPDPDRYDGWARWSGTSFSAPVVTAALLRHMATTGPGVTANDAVEWVVDRPSLFRIPGLGTVVNWTPAHAPA